VKVQIRKKKHATVTSRELYNHYVDNQEPGEFTLDYTKWKKVLFEVFHRISRAMIVENLILVAPYSMGRFGIEKSKGKAKRRVDFQKSKELGRTVFHDNLHTNCFFFRFSWRRRVAHQNVIKNLTVYKFTAVLDATTRKIGRRGLAKWAKDCSKDPYTKDYDAPFKI
jgi:hypothetical protein